MERTRSDEHPASLLVAQAPGQVGTGGFPVTYCEVTAREKDRSDWSRRRCGRKDEFKKSVAHFQLFNKSFGKTGKEIFGNTLICFLAELDEKINTSLVSVCLI